MPYSEIITVCSEKRTRTKKKEKLTLVART